MSTEASSSAELQTRQFVALASQTFLIYDFILTLPLEVDYIWEAPWRAVKVIFLLNRYGNLIGQSVFTLEELGLLGSEKFCEGFPWFVAFFAVLAQESIHILVLLRAWAIWGCKYRTAVALISAYVLYISASVGLLIHGLVIATRNPFPFIYLGETSSLCVWQGSSNIWLKWILPSISFLLDSMVFILVACTLGKLFKQTHGFQRSPVLRALTVDASLFFVVNTILDAIAILCQTAFANGSQSSLVIACIPLLSVTGQRVVLNLRRLTPRRQAAYQSEDREITTERSIPFWQSVKRWMTSRLPEQEPERNPEPSEVDTESAFELLVME